MQSRSDHTKILLGSLGKMFKEAKKRGTYSVRDLFFLNCLYKVLSFSCEIKMTQEEQRELSEFYFKILGASNKFCSIEFQSESLKDLGSTMKKFHVQEKGEDVSPPEVDSFTLGDNGEMPPAPILEPMGTIFSITAIDESGDMWMEYEFRQEVLDRPYTMPNGQDIFISVKRPTDTVERGGYFTDYGSPVNMWNTKQEFFPGESMEEVYPPGTVIKFKDGLGIYGDTNGIVCP